MAGMLGKAECLLLGRDRQKPAWSFGEDWPAYASRAFALYYTLQSAIAGRLAFIILGTPWQKKLGFSLLVALGSMIVLFGNDEGSSNTG